MENSECENKKISFRIDVGGGKKLRLIDISTEDDYLIASPLFDSLEDLRLSVALDSSNAHENLKSSSLATQNAAEFLQQSEPKFLPLDFMEPRRPSYLRKSLAWDTSFFTNAGVLDPDELALMNKGFKSCPLRGIHEPAPQVKSISMQSLKKSRIGVRSNMQQTDQSGERHRLARKPPKVSTQVKDLPTRQNERDFTGKKHDHVIVKDKFAGTRSVPNLMVCKKLAVSSTANKSSSLSCLSYSSPRRASSPDVSSNHLKRKIESRMGKLSASLSTSTTPSRFSGKSKQLTDLSLTTQSLSMSSHSFARSPASSTDLKPRHSTTKSRRTRIQNESTQANDSQKNDTSSPLHLNTACTIVDPMESTESFQQSGLRMPSPKIGFFDEDKSAANKIRGVSQSQFLTTSPKTNGASGRKPPAKLSRLGNVERVSQTSGKLKRSSPVGSGYMRDVPGTASSRYIDTSTGMEGESCFKSRKIGVGEHDRRNICQSSSLKTEERLEVISRNKLNKGFKGQKAKGSTHPIKEMGKRKSSKDAAEVNELSKFLQVIDLNKDMAMEIKQRSYNGSNFRDENILYNEFQVLPNLTGSNRVGFSPAISSTRTPLGDRTSVCNRGGIGVEKHQRISPSKDIDKRE